MDDTIQLENAVLKALTATGPLAAADVLSLSSGAAAATVGAGVNLIYDRGSGNLYYDANGGDVANRTRFATLTASPDGITNLVFVVT